MGDERTGTDIATIDTDFSAVVASQNSKAVFLPQDLGQAMQLAHFMAGGIGVRQWMRGNPSACLALIQISMRWGLDPYIVANKAYYTNDTLSFESQLVNAVINTSGQLIGRLNIEFTGEAHGFAVGQETLVCRVSGRLKADPEKVKVLDQPLCDVKIRNSPVWKVNPKLQLAYHATRSWARLYMPEVLLGIYTPDEIADGAAAAIEDQSTARTAAPAPDRRKFVAATEEQRPDNAVAGERIPSEDRVEDAQFEEIQTHLPDDEPSAGEDETDENGGDDAVEHSASPEGQAAAAPDTAGKATSERPVELLDTVPVEPLEWAMWKRDVLAAIGAIGSLDDYNALRSRIRDALDAADDALLNEIQDALSDKFVSLPEGK